MANKKKPTNKELLNEINLVGNKMMDLYAGLRNLGNIFDLYLVYKEDQESFNKFIQEKLKEKAEADKKAKEEKPKD
tara:strand:+ start:715 stop:942 length:228 start_codon:yes stop_codon:yes gene_type:complete